MSALLDKLKLLGVAFLLIGALVAIQIWNPFSSQDDEIIDLAGKFAVELCACTDIECANRVSEEAARELEGQKVTRNKEVGGGAHTQAMDQIMHMSRCHQLISEGRAFTVEKADGKVDYVNESALDFDMPTF